MFRRLFWIGIGAGLALYSRSKVLQTIEKYVPAPIRRAIKRTVDGFVEEFKATRAENKKAQLEQRSTGEQ